MNIINNWGNWVLRVKKIIIITVKWLWYHFLYTLVPLAFLIQIVLYSIMNIKPINPMINADRQITSATDWNVVLGRRKCFVRTFLVSRMPACVMRLSLQFSHSANYQATLRWFIINARFFTGNETQSVVKFAVIYELSCLSLLCSLGVSTILSEDLEALVARMIDITRRFSSLCVMSLFCRVLFRP